MHRTNHVQRVIMAALAGAYAAGLAGCGAGSAAASATAGDPVAFAETISYCGLAAPAGTSGTADGWVLSSPRPTAPQVYDVNAIVSPQGATSAGLPVRLQVDIHDYRAVRGSFVLPGSADPLAKMGVNFTPVLAPKSAGCVVSLGKLTPDPASGAGRYTLEWRSKWSALAIADLPGRPLDGFEFVADFTPAEATVFFFVPKPWLADPQGLSLCHRAPGASSWDCAAATVSDTGTHWRVTRAGAAPGAYVITVPAATTTFFI